MMERTPRPRTSFFFFLPVLFAASACDPGPKNSPPPSTSSLPTPAPPAAPVVPTKSRESDSAETRCIFPMPEERPREVFSVESCPPDVDGRPTMPTGQVEFLNVPGSTKIRVEHAVTDAHRMHGLMFRPSLSDDEGMLFSWSKEAPRGFWMHNTCLALDMLFIAADDTVIGVLEQVPPMNDETRSVGCPAAHVLEVRAGWARQHGVKPGQKIRIDSPVLPKN